MTETMEAFRKGLLETFYASMHQLVENNFDAKRYNFDGVDRAHQFDVEEHVFFLNWFFVNQREIFEASQALDDEVSRDLFKDLLVYRFVGHHHYRIKSAVLRNQSKYAELSAVAIPSSSALPISGVFGRLKHYDFEWHGKKYLIDCIEDGLSATLAFGQYFFSRDGMEVAPSRGDFVVDGGACLGDTALVFSNAVGECGRVYAFDPVEDNLLACIENSEKFQYKNVSVYPTGLSDRNVDAPPIKVNCYAPGFSSGNAESNHQKVPLRTLDFLLKTGEVERVDFIKLDVEGAEMEALAGARGCIDRFRPKLAISTYHKPDDFFEIINYIRTAHPFYSLHLDHYTIHREETVLYCLAP